MEIEIRTALSEDVESFHELHQFWINNKSIKQRFSKDELNTIVSNQQAVVAIDKGQVVSYYLVNSFFDTGNVKERENIINQLISNKVLPHGKYALSLQSATNENYFGRGLNTKVLNQLRHISMDKYDFFVGVMAYDNIPTQKSSLKMGWKHFGDIGIGLLAVIGTTEEKNNLLVQV